MWYTTDTLQTFAHFHNQEKFKAFSDLRDALGKTRSEDTARRIEKNPFPTAEENVLGAFLEMYEPHIRAFILPLLEKGYTLYPFSGFCGRYAEGQALSGWFTIEHIMENKLAKIGVKIQKDTQCKSIKFWPEVADMDQIVKKYREIIDILPDQPTPAQPSQTVEAKIFRMRYVPHDAALKRQRLFEILMNTIHEQTANDVKARLSKNPKPSEIEQRLGTFIEMIEPHVRDAVLTLHQKGYTIDASGFMSNATSQTIDGDFNIEEEVKIQLQTEGISVETNPSGYTRVQFWPTEANIEAIKKKWDALASLLPDKGKLSDPSMTRNARDFRKRY